MKKLFGILIILFFSFSYAFAEECSIQGDSSAGLKAYLENNNSILKEFNNQLSKAEIEAGFIDKTWGTAKEQGLKFYNRVFSFDGYFSTFKYYAIFPIANEIPWPIKRDYNLLDRERERLNSYVRTTVKNLKGDVIIKDICSKVKEGCDFPSEITANELLSLLVKNNDKVMDFYRKVVMGDEEIQDPELILVPNNFIKDIQTYYSKEAYATCSKEEGGFFDRISTKIDEISNVQYWIKDGIQKWKDARALLIGKDMDAAKQAQKEKELLMDYMGKHGIGSNSQSNMLSALDKYNQGGFTEGFNPIGNMYDNIWNKNIERGKEYLDDQILDFFNKKQSSETIPIETVILAQSNSDATKELSLKIDKIYNELSTLSAPSEYNASNLISRIIKIHEDILQSIESLTISCEDAVKICQQQDPSKGDCGKCN